jgi:N-acetylmuramoyl-L-alanine amidase
MRISKFIFGLIIIALFIASGSCLLAQTQSKYYKFWDQSNGLPIQLPELKRDDHVYLPLIPIMTNLKKSVSWNYKTGEVILGANNLVQMILLQPTLLLGTDSLSIDPICQINGQLAITPLSARLLLESLLSQNVYLNLKLQQLIIGNPPSELKQNSLLTPPLASRTRIIFSAPKSNKLYQVKTIIIDPGHGGIDSGAIGYDGRYFEKQATLAIALKVVAILRKHPGLQVLMTRTGDYYVSLQQRCQFANEHNGDVFVAIHCNSDSDGIAYGTETYIYSSHASSARALREANYENQGNGRFLSYIKADLREEAYRGRSFLLAEKIDYLIHKRLKLYVRRIQQAPFYVLAHVNMPSILIETAFISNPHEEKELEDPVWQERMAEAIADGILEYRKIVEQTVENK